MGDYDLSEISESSYADARADTPTLEGHHSGSEVSNLNLTLSFHEGLVLCHLSYIVAIQIGTF